MNVGMIMVGMLFLLLFGGTSYYVGHRLDQIVCAYLPPAAGGVLAGIVFLLSIVFVLRFFIIIFPVGKTSRHLINWLSSNWMGIFLYLLLFFILADLLIFIGRLTGIVPTPVPDTIRLCASVAAVCLAFGLSVYGMYHAGKIQTVSYEVPVSGNSEADGFHIVLISDLHLGAVTSEKKLETIVEKINQLEPDIICIAGDLFDSDYEAIQNPEKAAADLRCLKAKQGVFACLGNHDAGRTFAQMEEFFKECNIRCLNEESVTIDERIILAGRVDSAPIGAQGNYVRTTDKQVWRNRIETGMPVVVMDHNPANLSQYTEEADLILCGHTHHGQMWPANWVTDYGYYPKKAGTPQAVVTSGVGVWGMPMRVGSSCEIVSIKLIEETKHRENI